jgi:hypothetical protein
MSALRHPTSPSDPLRLSSQHPEAPPDHLLFNPPPEIATATIQDLADPFKSLVSNAQDRGTTLEGLTLWMQRPDIVRRLDALESACTRRSRLQANGYLPLCIHALSCAITGASRDESHTAPLQSSPKLDEQRRKARETLLRMTRVMMQLSKFQHVSARPAKSALPRPIVRPANPVDPRTSNSTAPSRVAANSASRSIEHSERRGNDVQPRVAPADQSRMESGESRAQQSAQLSSV